MNFINCWLGCQIFGQDISSYAIKNSKKEIRKFIKKGSATNLKYKSNYFDLVISLNTLHNLYCFDLVKSIEEIERVSKKQVHMYESIEVKKKKLIYYIGK